LLPGYVFLYVERFLPIKLKARARHLYKVLEYERGIAELSGSDADYANWLYRYQGQIRPSKILTLGDQVVAIDGPLKDCTGTILKLDRHKRKAWVEFTFDQQKRMVSLSAEWIEQQKA
jgi:transcriptional antiterminator NusG